MSPTLTTNALFQLVYHPFNIRMNLFILFGYHSGQIRRPNSISNCALHGLFGRCLERSYRTLQVSCQFGAYIFAHQQYSTSIKTIKMIEINWNFFIDFAPKSGTDHHWYLEPCTHMTFLPQCHAAQID